MNKLKNILKDLDKNIVLDKHQLEIVTDESRYLMVIAGAGSGKTTTIAAKVKYLIESKKCLINEILVISFTNKSVNDLKKVLHHQLELMIPIMTFHKLGLYILKEKKLNYEINNNQETIINDFIKDSFNDRIIKKSIKKYFKDYLDFKFYIFNKIEREYYEKFLLLVISFINKCNTNDIKISSIVGKDKKEKIFLEYISKINKNYQQYLRNNNYLDFDNMIKVSLKHVDDNLSFKYIVIDEYQDISKSKFELIKKIVEKINTRLMVVGDDFQTIYSFSGSDINLFLNYQKIYRAKVLKITNTYRNSQELIDIAGKFVMKNKNQIAKELKSTKNLNNPIEIIYYNDFKKNSNTKLSKLNKIINKIPQTSKILLLGRYKRDAEFLENQKIINNRIKFLTIHSSKGLEADYVIILNNEEGIHGFPSRISNDEMFKLLGHNDQINEERRLFYVALTRTRNKVYLLAPKRNKSIFIKEIEKIIKK